MKNKVWKNPTIVALNAKETKEEKVKQCFFCGGDHYSTRCPINENGQFPNPNRS